MKKKLLILFAVIVMCFSAFGCENQQAVEETTEPADLTGEWKQVNSASETDYQSATIQGETIEIYWVQEETDSKSLYWAGTFIAPTTSDEPYSWDSVNDTTKTEFSLMASNDTTKTITYENGQLSYETSILGTTQTVKLEKIETKE